jgi:hypothetical protein
MNASAIAAVFKRIEMSERMMEGKSLCSAQSYKLCI